jgi:hypothetical protein
LEEHKTGYSNEKLAWIDLGQYLGQYLGLADIMRLDKNFTLLADRMIKPEPLVTALLKMNMLSKD